MTDDNISWAGHSFWARAQEVTNRNLDAGYRCDVLAAIPNRKYPMGVVTTHAQRWADNMEDALQGEFEATVVNG